MSTFIFWGDFADVLKQVPATQQWYSVASSAPDVEAILKDRTLPSLLMITGDELNANATALLDLKQKFRNLSVLATYTKADTQENIHWLKIVPVVEHLVPHNAKITVDLFTRLSTQEGKVDFEKNPERIFIPSELANPRSFTLRHVNDCKKCYEELDKYIQELGCFMGFSEIMITAASELLTNAFYNGKRDPITGKAVTPDRQVKFALAENESITFSFGVSGNYVWMFVQDSFGSLDRMTLINAMNRAATERTANTSTPGGAGLGLIMLYEWATELGFSLVRGKSTMVACKFRITKRQREFDSEPSAAHILGGV